MNEVKSQALMIEKLKHQLHGFNKDRYGVSSESLDQLGLKLEDEETDRSAIEARSYETTFEDFQDKDDPATSKSKPVRRALPEHLPRQDISLMPDVPCAGCGADMSIDSNAKTLGEDVLEELEYVPGRYVVNRIIRPRVSCKSCERIAQADMPSRPIPKSYASPSLLSHIIVSKYCDHLPLYRQSQMMAREGVDIDRSTLAGWVGRSAYLLERLTERVKHHVFQSPAIFADDTPIGLLAPGTGKTKMARMWIYSCDQRPWAGDHQPAAWYQFTPDRQGQRPQKHLTGYRGFIHADGYAGFNKLYAKEDITEMACMAHIRRKFVDVFHSQGSSIAEEAIKRIAELYKVETEARGSPPEQRVHFRQTYSKQKLIDLEDWLSKQLTQISGKTPLATAIRYALTRIPKVRPYLEHGFLELDNNTAERAMRPIAVGRKNYLFLGSEKGGKSAATLYSLIETAKLNGINPQSWLTHVLTHIQDTKVTNLDCLLPWNYEKGE